MDLMGLKSLIFDIFWQFPRPARIQVPHAMVKTPKYGHPFHHGTPIMGLHPSPHTHTLSIVQLKPFKIVNFKEAQLLPFGNQTQQWKIRCRWKHHLWMGDFPASHVWLSEDKPCELFCCSLPTVSRTFNSSLLFTTQKVWASSMIPNTACHELSAAENEDERRKEMKGGDRQTIK